MADTFVDLTGSGSNTSPYETWAKATASVQTGLTTAGAGGRCFVKDDATGSNPDTAAATRTLTSPGTKSNPTFLYGCKSGTTNEPPVDADLTTRGDADIPIFQTTGGTSQLKFDNYCIVEGFKFDSGDRFEPLVTSRWVFRRSEIKWDEIIFADSQSGQFAFEDCEFLPSSTGAHFLVRSGSVIEVWGGVVNGTVPTFLINTAPVGTIIFNGTDLSAINTTLCDLASVTSFSARFINCATHVNVTLTSGTPNDSGSFAEFVQTNNDSGLGSGASIRDYTRERLPGTVQHEFTAVRTNGANDGADGAYSLAMTPNVDSTLESGLGLVSPWVGGIIEGDGTTSKIFTLFFANSLAESSPTNDYHEDDVGMELMSPDDGGTAKHDYSINAGFDKISGGTTDIASDGSTWGSGANNAQKLTVTITPDFTGPVYARLTFYKRFAASPDTLYLDAKLDIADA